jgi:O-antigen/teichoic acid export membrane protein
MGAWALADQGVVSLGTFLTSIVLARSLPPSQYGIYGVYLAVFLSLNTVHWSLVTYPLSTSGAASFPHALKPAATGALWLTAGLSLPLLAAPPLVGMATGSTGTVWLALAALNGWSAPQRGYLGRRGQLPRPILPGVVSGQIAIRDTREHLCRNGR